MKKITIILVTLLLCALLSACGSKTVADSESQVSEAQSETTEITTDTAQQSDLISEENENLVVQFEDDFLTVYDNVSDAMSSAENFPLEVLNGSYTLTLITSGATLESVHVSGLPLEFNGYTLFSGDEYCSLSDMTQNIYFATLDIVPITNRLLFTFTTKNGTVYYSAVKVF